MNAEKTLENLSRNGFDAKYFETAAQAADYLAAQLHGKIVQRTAVLLRVRQIVFDPRRAERKELCIAAEALRLLQ